MKSTVIPSNNYHTSSSAYYIYLEHCIRKTNYADIYRLCKLEITTLRNRWGTWLINQLVTKNVT